MQMRNPDESCCTLCSSGKKEGGDTAQGIMGGGNEVFRVEG